VDIDNSLITNGVKFLETWLAISCTQNFDTCAPKINIKNLLAPNHLSKASVSFADLDHYWGADYFE
jgi:hypothetical protein